VSFSVTVEEVTRLIEDYVTQTEELFLKSPFAKGSGVDDRTGKQVQAET
jgi:hypothetical protein